MRRRFSFSSALCALLMMVGCGPIPKDTATGSDGANELVYADKTWGFEISRPTNLWGISAESFPQQHDVNNGLPYVDVRIASPLYDSQGSAFRPELRMEPRGLPSQIALDALALSFEQDQLTSIFSGYQAVGDKVVVKLDGGTAIEWEFRNVQAPQSAVYPGTWFLAAVAIHDKQAYFIIANGSADGYPVDAYRQIVASLRFTSNK